MSACENPMRLAVCCLLRTEPRLLLGGPPCLPIGEPGQAVEGLGRGVRTAKTEVRTAPGHRLCCSASLQKEIQPLLSCSFKTSKKVSNPQGPTSFPRIRTITSCVATSQLPSWRGQHDSRIEQRIQSLRADSTSHHGCRPLHHAHSMRQARLLP